MFDLWIPPKPAIIRPAEPKLVKASFLPGWFPSVAAVSSRLTTITQVLSSTSLTSTIDVPVGVVSGDLIVLLDVPLNSASPAPSLVTPSGFTNSGINFIDSLNVRRMALSFKIASGSEGGTTLTGMNGSTANNKSLLVFRGNIPFVTATVLDVGTQATDGNPTAQTVTSGSGTVPLIVFGCYRSQGDIDPRTFTQGGSPAKDGEINPNTFGYLAWKIFNQSPSDIVVDMDDEGNQNMLASCYFEMS